MEGENGNETSPKARLRGFFFPLASPGHMIPLIEIAKLLSRRGVAATIVTTPGNEQFARPIIDRTNSISTAFLPIELILLPFPPSAAIHLLPGNNHENLSNIQSSAHSHLYSALESLLPSLHDLLRRHRPDFFVSDAVFTWTAGMALDLGIPHIDFRAYSFLGLCMQESVSLMSIDDETKSIIFDDLPDLIELSRSEFPSFFADPLRIKAMKDSEAKSFGVVVNTFNGLGPAYADFYRRFRAGRRAWFVGPVSLSNTDDIYRRDSGNRAHPDTIRLMRWLDAQPARSVVYVCFGSLNEFDAVQMQETAAGLETAGYRFIWAVKDWEGAAAPAGWLPDGFEERVEGRGVMVRGWVPQVAILEHEATGAFVTHCGWNSTLEGVAAGLPFVAWPLMYEQFVNAKLITEVLRVGVAVRKGRGPGAVVAAELAEALGRVMGGGEEEGELRQRAGELRKLAREAMEEGGTSYGDVGRMVEELEAEVRRLSLIRKGEEGR